MKTVLLQCKFFLVAYLNFSYMFFPNPLRNYYLRLFGIKIDKGSCIFIVAAIFFMLANLRWDRILW